jgi:hypothetical protein
MRSLLNICLGAALLQLFIACNPGPGSTHAAAPDTGLPGTLHKFLSHFIDKTENINILDVKFYGDSANLLAWVTYTDNPVDYQYTQGYYSCWHYAETYTYVPQKNAMHTVALRFTYDAGALKKTVYGYKSNGACNCDVIVERRDLIKASCEHCRIDSLLIE